MREVTKISKNLAETAENLAFGVSSHTPQFDQLSQFSDDIGHQTFSDRHNPENQKIFSNRQTRMPIKGG